MTVSAELMMRTGMRYLRLIRSQFDSSGMQRRETVKKLASVLEASAKIPFYRDRYQGFPSPEVFHELPVVARRDIPELNRSVRSRYPSGKAFLADRSSGSTGMPAEFLFDTGHQSGRYAARIRYLTQNNWQPFKRTAWLVPLPENTPDGRLMKRRHLMGSRFLSIFTPAEEQTRWLERLDPHFIYSLPSNLEAIAKEMARLRIQLPRLEKVFSGGEVLEDAHRDKIRDVLGVTVSDNYGSTEGFCAWQCPAGGYHVNTEHVLLEILDQAGNPVAPGQVGWIVITTLENRLMPLIRYAIGDMGVMSPAATCSCGRTLPMLESILGRSINMFRSADGRTVSPWAIVVKLKHLPGMIQFQIIQKSPELYVFRTRADFAPGPARMADIAAAFHETLGHSVRIEFEAVPEIERAASGKFMTAISEVTS